MNFFFTFVPIWSLLLFGNSVLCMHVSETFFLLSGLFFLDFPGQGETDILPKFFFWAIFFSGRAKPIFVLFFYFGPEARSKFCSRPTGSQI